jgi:hypothetical protein
MTGSAMIFLAVFKSILKIYNIKYWYTNKYYSNAKV